MREYFHRYPDCFTEEEQVLGDALTLLALDSIAPVSEDSLLAENVQKAFRNIITNDITKLYICASWGKQTADDLNESNEWINRQIEFNDLDIPKRPTNYTADNPEAQEILAELETMR